MRTIDASCNVPADGARYIDDNPGIGLVKQRLHTQLAARLTDERLTFVREISTVVMWDGHLRGWTITITWKVRSR